MNDEEPKLLNFFTVRQVFIEIALIAAFLGLARLPTANVGHLDAILYFAARPILTAIAGAFIGGLVHRYFLGAIAAILSWLAVGLTETYWFHPY